jgi:hypothetical protein
MPRFTDCPPLCHTLGLHIEIMNAEILRLTSPYARNVNCLDVTPNKDPNFMAFIADGRMVL